MSQKDRERLKNFIPPQNRSEEPTPIATPLPPSEKPLTPRQFVYPRIEPPVAKAALSGFKPFATDPVKQARYTAYLKSQSEVVSDEDRLQLKQQGGQDLEHFQSELEEYAQAATVFKPLSGAMAGRFTTAKAVELGPAVIEGLHTPPHSTLPSESKGPETKEDEPENAKTHAVKHGMYGILTRETSVWVPVRLLCKRFGVKEPETVVQEEDPAPSSRARNEWEPEVAFAEAELVAAGSGSVSSSAAVSQSVGGGNRSNRRDFNNIGLGEDETQGADILTYQKPERSIFKAIFASDEEDSDDEDQAKVEDADPHDTPVPATSGTLAQHSKEGVQMDVDDGPVDLATFKPKFVPRAERIIDDNPPPKRRKKDKEKRKGGKALVSFDVEGDGEATTDIASKSKDKDREKKKKRRSKDKDSGKDRDRKERPKEEADDDDDMWVEKAVPEAVQKMNVDQLPETPKEKAGETGKLSKRMRAEDFM
jgi:G patch domain-containing protein 1